MQFAIAHYTALFDFDQYGTLIMVFNETAEFKRRCFNHCVNLPVWAGDQIQAEIETHLASTDSTLCTVVKVESFGTVYLTTHRGHLLFGYNSSLSSQLGIR